MQQSASKYKSSIPTCSLCRNEYDQYYRIPRVIPKCGHTFCEKCINSSVQVRANRKMFICPQCSSETIIRKGAAEDVPKNIGILDIVKTMKKNQISGQSSPYGHKSPSRQSPLKHKLYCRQHPTKQLDLICQTCNYQKVCSICALIGNSQHQDHKFVQYIPASRMDLNEVKQVFVIIEDTVKQTILPKAQENIIKRNQENLIKDLVSIVKEHFRQHYYKVIQKKENQVIAQVRQIKFQGGIQNKIQEIAKHYDLLKIQYGQIFTKSVEKQNASLQIVDQLIQKCKDLHKQVETFSEYAQSKSKQLFKQISTKITQSTYFRLSQLPFSLKQLLSSQHPQVKSPSKKIPIYSEELKKIRNKVQMGLKQVSGKGQRSVKNERSISRNQDDLQSIQNISFDLDRKPFTTNSMNTKNGTKSGFMPPKQKVTINKSQVNIEKKDQQMIPTLDINSKLKQKKSSSSQSKSITQRFNKKPSSFEQQYKQSVQKPMNNRLNNSRLSQEYCMNDHSSQEYSQQQGNSLVMKIKDFRPQKEIPLALKSKFSMITKEITRQAESQSLELIGMEINDQLIGYICDYLKLKKLKFSMIKLVKNALTDEGLSILLGYLQNDDQTQVLNLTSNQLTSKCLQLFVEVAGKNDFLKTIYLSHNKVTSLAVKQKTKQLENLGIDIIL